MLPPSGWVPFEWPATWTNPSLLRHLEGGPLNCILLSSNEQSAIREAASGRFDIPQIAWRKSSELNWKSPGQVAAIGDAVWPELARRSRESNGSMEAGPTGAPWLDANGWLILMARFRAGSVPVWIRSESPENADQLQLANYRLAIAEAGAYGATRPLWLAPTLASGIASGNDFALATWAKLLNELRWHQARREYSAWPGFGRLLILTAFSGANEYNATEVLNLSARRNLSFRLADPGDLPPAQLQGIQSVLYVDAEPLPQPAAAALRRFVEAGGLLLCMKQPAGTLGALRPSAELHPRFDLFQAGKGRVAISRGAWDDQWVLAQDAHLLMSRRHDAVRLFNGSSLLFHHSVSPDGRRWLVQLLNYSAHDSASNVTLQTWARLASARILLPELAPAPLEIHRETGASELYIPRFSTYAAVELELQDHA
ncbi:MAG: hypothetical protein HY821_19140 [Acidobacteria bacterium]|nr:hypothetical protein [Acidobacteriota bacterium]